MPTDDNVPELVARLRMPNSGHLPALREDAALALESLHAEVERAEESARFQARMNAKATAALADRNAEVESQRSIIDRQTNAYNNVAARLADRDAQIAEALALCEKESGEIRTRYAPDGPYTGYANACDDLAKILSRSPRGAASYSRSSLPVHQCRAPEAHYGHRWRDVGLDHDEWCKGRAFDDPSWAATGIAP